MVELLTGHYVKGRLAGITPNGSGWLAQSPHRLPRHIGDAAAASGGEHHHLRPDPRGVDHPAPHADGQLTLFYLDR